VQMHEPPVRVVALDPLVVPDRQHGETLPAPHQRDQADHRWARRFQVPAHIAFNLPNIFVSISRSKPL
jgi:hypothetical protein